MRHYLFPSLLVLVLAGCTNGKEVVQDLGAGEDATVSTIFDQSLQSTDCVSEKGVEAAELLGLRTAIVGAGVKAGALLTDEQFCQLATAVCDGRGVDDPLIADFWVEDPLDDGAKRGIEASVRFVFCPEIT